MTNVLAHCVSSCAHFAMLTKLVISTTDECLSSREHFRRMVVECFSSCAHVFFLFFLLLLQFSSSSTFPLPPFLLLFQSFSVSSPPPLHLLSSRIVLFYLSGSEFNLTSEPCWGATDLRMARKRPGCRPRKAEHFCFARVRFGGARQRSRN